MADSPGLPCVLLWSILRPFEPQTPAMSNAGQTASAPWPEDISRQCSLEGILQRKGESLAGFPPLGELALAEHAIFIDTPSVSRKPTPGTHPLLLTLICGRRLHLLYIKAFACAQLNDYPFLMCYDKDDWVLNLLALLQDHF